MLILLGCICKDMRKLKDVMDPVEYAKLIKDGVNAYYAEIFTDQRAMSVEGRPFKSGATESIVFKCLRGILYT